MDRTLALKLFSGAKRRNFPSREELPEFGRTVCRVCGPERVLERIGTAMSETWREHGARLDGEFRAGMAAEWEYGRKSMAAPQVFPGR